MARAQIKYVVTDQRSGKVIQNAKVIVYETGTTTLVTDLFAALTGGAAIASAELVSNAQGEVEGYVTTPRNVRLWVTDNGDTCYYPATPGRTLSFTPFEEDPTPAYEDPVEGETDDADMMRLSTAQTATGLKTFSAGADISTVRVKDKPWVDPTHPSFGVTAASTDNTAAFQAACDAAHANSVDVLIPPLPEPDYYEVRGTIDLIGLNGLKIGALGGGLHRSVRIANVTDNDPIFKIDGEAALAAADGFVFERLRLQGYGLLATAVRGVLLDRCVFIAGGLGHALQAENSWGWKIKHCEFASLSTTYKSIKLIGRTPAVDVGICYLIDFDDCLFTNGGVLYDQQATGTIVLPPIRWRNCYTETFAASLSSLLEIQSPASTNLTLTNWAFEGIEMYDSTGGTPPLVRHKDGTILWRGTSFDRCSNGTSGVNLVQVEASTRFPTFRDTVFHGCGGGNIVTGDGITEYNVQQGTQYEKDGGGYVVSRSEYANFSDMRGLASMPYGVSKAGDRHLAWGRDHDGTEHYGPVGATGSGNKFDTAMGRGGVGFMYVPMLVKAGVPADGDFAVTPPNGTLAVNSSVPQIYCRIGGVWTAV